MPNTVERVKEQGESKEALERNLGGGGPCGDRRNHGCGLEVPSCVRRGEVGKAEEVQRARERDAGDTVERRGVPGDLRAVDREMGGDGAVQALLGEDLGGGFLGSGFSGGEPGDVLGRA